MSERIKPSAIREKSTSSIIGRREFLSRVGEVSLSTLLVTGAMDPQSLPSDQAKLINSSFSAPDTQYLGEQDAHLEDHHEHKESSIFNDLSAYAISASFLGLLGAVLAGKAEFGAKSATMMASAEIARMIGLKFTDPEAFTHEAQELAISFGVLPVLLSIAETAAHFKAENDAVFSENKALLSRETEINEITDLTRPELHESVEQWESYLSNRKQKLVAQTAQNAALASVLAPIATTYTSASIATQNLPNTFDTLEDVYFAQSVLEDKRKVMDSGIILTDESAAKKKAAESINGPLGYLNANIALSANLNGAGFLGDPPYIFFALNHPDLYLKASGMGLAYSELMTTVINYTWLQNSVGGINPIAFAKQFADYQIQTLQKLSHSVTEGSLRDISFNGGRAVGEHIHESLRKIQNNVEPESAAKDIAKQLHEIPDPAFILDWKAMINEKIHRLQRMNRKDFHPEHDHFSIDDFAQLVTSEQFQNGLHAENTTEVKNTLDQLHDLLRKNNIDKLTALFEGLLQRTEELPTDEIVAHQLSTIPLNEENNKDTSELQKSLRELTSGVEPVATSTEGNTDVQFYTDLKNIYDKLGLLGKSDIAKAIQDAVIISEGESVDTHKGFVTHQTKEVFYVLLTQLCVVPGVVHSVEKTLPKIVGVPEGQKPTFEQLMHMTRAILLLISTKSAFADNVAAYLFGEKVLTSLYKSYYGEEVYSQNKQIEEALSITALNIAVLAGSLSKYGNGPNVTMNGLDENKNPIPVQLGKSLTNGYAYLQTSIGAGLMDQYIKQSLPDV